MKRERPDQPLQPDDIAERLDKAAHRVVRILRDVRAAEGDLYEQVRRSRYLTGWLSELASELDMWGVPRPTPDDEQQR